MKLATKKKVETQICQSSVMTCPSWYYIIRMQHIVNPNENIVFVFVFRNYISFALHVQLLFLLIFLFTFVIVIVIGWIILYLSEKVKRSSGARGPWWFTYEDYGQLCSLGEVGIAIQTEPLLFEIKLVKAYHHQT